MKNLGSDNQLNKNQSKDSRMLRQETVTVVV